MISGSFRDQVIGAVRAAMAGPSQTTDPFIVEEETRAMPVAAGHHGYVTGGSASVDRGCFAIRNNRLDNTYFWNGSQMVRMPSLEITDEMEGLILAISLQGDVSPRYEFYSSVNSLNLSAASQDAIIIPLYKFAKSSRGVEIDFRTMPRGDGWAVFA